MLSESQQHTLLKLARQSIESFLETGQAPDIRLADYAAELTQALACFVTLQQHGRLRGCIGSLEARRALVCDVSANAISAALRDPRFAAVTRQELDDITIEISILTTPQSMSVFDESDLLKQLVPDRDGLILQAGNQRATFLPSVWKQLPNPEDFLRHLKLKAGLQAQDWPSGILFSRYHCEIFSE